MKSTLQPNPNPVEFKPFETSFVPLAESSFVKLSLQVGHAVTETIPKELPNSIPRRIFLNCLIQEIYLRTLPLASAPCDARLPPTHFLNS